MALPKDYDDLPGTVVFDADRAREGYHLNMFCMSMMKPELANGPIWTSGR
jgi:protocatechuate 4,5-dioxygenase alpha subunit